MSNFKQKFKGLVSNIFQGGTVEGSARPNPIIEDTRPTPIKDKLNDFLSGVKLPTVQTSSEIKPNTLSPILLVGGLALLLILTKKK